MNNNKLQWEVWERGSKEAWIETIIPYEAITDKIIKAGIEVFKAAHDCSPNTIVINPKKDELIFKIKKIANNNQLSAIAEYDVPEEVLVFVNMPSGDGGETMDEDDLDILELLKQKKAA